LPNSTFSIQAVTHSYDYGQELQFVSWSRQPPRLERRAKDNSEYYRFEAGYLPLTHESAQQLRDIADKIDQLIGYSEPTVSFMVKQSKPAVEIKKLIEVLH